SRARLRAEAQGPADGPPWHRHCSTGATNAASAASPLRMSRPFRVLGRLGAALLLAAAPARGASKALVAAIGGAVPGGGVFPGPGFAGAPTAAGGGWVAFRGAGAGGGSSEP